MNVPDYIMRAVATELLERQNGHCAACESEEAYCITYLPKDPQEPVLGDLKLYCSNCVEREEKKAEKSRLKELEELQKRSEIEVED